MAQEKGSGSAGALPSLNVLDTEIIAQKEKECNRLIEEALKKIETGTEAEKEELLNHIKNLYKEITKLKEQNLAFQQDLNKYSEVLYHEVEKFDKIGNLKKAIDENFERYGEQTALTIGEAYSRAEKQLQDLSRRVDLLRSSAERATQKFGEREYTWLDYAMFGLIFLNVVVTVLVLLIR